MMKFNLLWPLGQYGDFNPKDVHALKVALNRLGYYNPPPLTGIEEMREPALFDSISAFQRDHGIEPTRHLWPCDPTVRALDTALKKQNPQQRYRWRTVRDARVRDEHAIREGEIFTWGFPATDGHPGEPPNCRCWAELIVEPERKKSCGELSIELQNEKIQLEVLDQQLKAVNAKYNAALEELQEAQDALDKARGWQGLEMAIAGAGSKIVLSAMDMAVAYFANQDAVHSAGERVKAAENAWRNTQAEIEDIKRWDEETHKNIKDIEAEMIQKNCPI